MDGQPEEIPGLVTRSWLDVHDPLRPPRTEMRYRRPDRDVSGIVWHTVHGDASGAITTGAVCADESEAMRYARYFKRNSRTAASHLIVADNGTVLCLADLRDEATWHAGGWNGYTIGIELDQEGPRGICGSTIDAAVTLAWWLSARFDIQAQLPARDGKPDLADIPRLLDHDGGHDFRGHYFHANHPNRCQGDPGPALPRALLASGFEGFDIRKGEDLSVWNQRQIAARVVVPDGRPGRRTADALERSIGRRLWAKRA